MSLTVRFTSRVARGAALGLLLVPSVALATPVAVPTPSFPDAVPQAQREQLAAEVDGGLTRSHAQAVVVDASGCGDELGCVGETAAAAGAEHALLVQVSQQDSDYAVKVRIVDAGGGVVVNLEESCELCGVAELGELLGDLTGRAIEKLETASRPGTLALTSTPAGASVFVDDELVGTTPFELLVAAGDRSIRVELDGHITHKRTATLVAGERVAINFSLQPVPVASAAPEEPTALDRGKGLRGAGYALLGIGIAGVGGGAALIAIDEHPITSDCSGDDVDADGDCRWRRNTLGAGIGLAAGGAVLIGTSVALIVTGKRRRDHPENARLRPTASGFQLSF